MLDKLYITPLQWLRILRWTLYSLLLLLALLLQTVVFGGGRTLLGVQPDLVPVVIVCVCLREGAERGGTFALLASLFWHLSGAEYGSVCILVYTVLPVAGALVCRAMLAERFVPCLLTTLVTLFVGQAAVFLLKFFFEGLAGIYFLRRLLPCVLVSLLFQPVVYLLVRRIGKIGEKHEST